MIIHIDKKNILKIKNSYFMADALKYVKINENLLEQLRERNLEIDTQNFEEEYFQKIETLKKKGAILRNSNKSIYINQISPSCIACATGIGGVSAFISFNCNRNCFYCYQNRNDDYINYFQMHNNDYIAEIDHAYNLHKEIKFMGLSGGEPLLHKKETIDLFKYVNENFSDTHKKLYTNGDFIDQDILKELMNVQLNEIRFSIKIEDYKQSKAIFDKIALAKKYIPQVIVEMPCIPRNLEIMKNILLELDELDIFGINLLEFLHPLYNIKEFNNRFYKLKNRPYKILYNYANAGGLPISQSETECLDLIEYTIDEGLNIGVHYCSLENKLTSQIYQQNIGANKKTGYFSKKDYFIKSARVYGDDIFKVLEIFQENNYEQYETDKKNNFIEFHINKIKLLEKLDIEVGIVYSVAEKTDNGKVFYRQLHIDLAYPKEFNIKTDI